MEWSSAKLKGLLAEVKKVLNNLGFYKKEKELSAEVQAQIAALESKVQTSERITNLIMVDLVASVFSLSDVPEEEKAGYRSAMKKTVTEILPQLFQLAPSAMSAAGVTELIDMLGDQ